MTDLLLDSISYNGMHQRLRRVLGNANLFSCVDCGKQASQWSLTITSNTVVFFGVNAGARNKRKLPYSKDMSDYSPRCGSCHVDRDNPFVRGSTNGNAKLTEVDVLDIRFLFDNGANRQEIADHFDVSLSTVNKIGARDYWSWLEEEGR